MSRLSAGIRTVWNRMRGRIARRFRGHGRVIDRCRSLRQPDPAISLACSFTLALHGNHPVNRFVQSDERRTSTMTLLVVVDIIFRRARSTITAACENPHLPRENDKTDYLDELIKAGAVW